MSTNLRLMAAGFAMSNLLAGQIVTTIVGASAAEPVPLVYPNCTTPNFAVPAKPKDMRRFVHGDQVRESGGRREVSLWDPVSIVYDGTSAWALTASSQILRLDMVTGKVVESHCARCRGVSSRRRYHLGGNEQGATASLQPEYAQDCVDGDAGDGVHH